jgi:hypothetical protein
MLSDVLVRGPVVAGLSVTPIVETAAVSKNSRSTEVKPEASVWVIVSKT